MAASAIAIACNAEAAAIGRPAGYTHGLRSVLGESAWERLPVAVRARFADPQGETDYVGEFEVVRASLLGSLIARACRLIGTPLAPRTGRHVPAIVRVGPRGAGVEWRREYRWSDRSSCIVRSTKVIETDGTLVEKLPARLCMALHVYEQGGILHFVSHRYYFEHALLRRGASTKVVLPRWLTPGTTHVEHQDQSDGWFRFTMTVTHPLFGELFYQSGRFRAKEAECLPYMH